MSQDRGGKSSKRVHHCEPMLTDGVLHHSHSSMRFGGRAEHAVLRMHASMTNGAALSEPLSRSSFVVARNLLSRSTCPATNPQINFGQLRIPESESRLLYALPPNPLRQSTEFGCSSWRVWAHCLQCNPDV